MLRVTFLDEAAIDPLGREQKKLPLFRTVYRRNGDLTSRRLDRRNILRMIKA